MTYVLDQNGENSFRIRHKDSDTWIGSVHWRDGRYRIWNDFSHEVDRARSLDEAIHAIECYFELNPPRWVRDSATLYVEETAFGTLRVEQEQPGQWFAYRNDFPLMREDKPAIFDTFEEARRAADTHMREGYPNSERINDGFSWLLDPEIAAFFAARTHHQVGASAH
jgi:hypothetical protein